MSAHGTERRYLLGCRCDLCRAESAVARKRRRHGEGPGKTLGGLQVHGISGYRRHRCRCEICRAANAAAQKRWYARHRSKAMS